VVEGDSLLTLLSALAGVERAFLLTNSSEHAEAQQIAFIDAARQASRAHCGCRSSEPMRSPGRFLRYHYGSRSGAKHQVWRIRFSAPTSSCRDLLNFDHRDQSAFTRQLAMQGKRG